jgi:hypothetical protein
VLILVPGSVLIDNVGHRPVYRRLLLGVRRPGGPSMSLTAAQHIIIAILLAAVLGAAVGKYLPDVGVPKINTLGGVHP